MNLNMEMLADALREEFEIAALGTSRESLPLEQSRLFEGDAVFKPGILYVAEGGKLPSKPFFDGHCGIVSIGASDKSYHVSNCDYLEIDKDASIMNVFNCIQEAYKKYNKWYLDMYEALLAESGAQKLLDLTLPLLGNPVYLHDKNYRFVAYAEIDGMSGGSDIYKIKSNSGRMSLDSINDLKNTPHFEKTFETTVPTFHVDAGELCYIYENVRVGGEYWGRLWVDERVKPFRKSDYAIVGVLKEMIEKALVGRRLSPGTQYRFLEQKLVSLLEGKPVEKHDLEVELLEKGFKPSDNWLCFQLQLSPADLLLNTAINFCDAIESKLQGCVAFPYGDFIVGIVCVDNPGATLKRIEDTLCVFELHAGVSLMFKGFGDFPLYCKQAGIALTYGIRENGQGWVHGFGDHCFSYMLDRCGEGLLSEMLYPPALLRLIEYDQKKSTSYVKTLRAYLEKDLKPARAMEALYIQRSTFLYRLARISEITGVDFEDEKVKIHFLLAFQLMDRDAQSS